MSALALSGSRIYVGGTFEHIGGKTRTNIAAINARTGRATAWQPRGDFEPFGPGSLVSALAVSGSSIYIGGHTGLAAFSTRTGAQIWIPEGSFEALALAPANSRLYVGGGHMDVKNPFNTTPDGPSLWVSGYSAVFGALNTLR